MEEDARRVPRASRSRLGDGAAYRRRRRCCSSSCFLCSAWSRIAAIPPVAPPPETVGVDGLASAAFRHTQPTLLAITTTESSVRPIDSHMAEHRAAESAGTSIDLPTPTLAGAVQAATSATSRNTAIRVLFIGKGISQPRGLRSALAHSSVNLSLRYGIPARN